MTGNEAGACWVISDELDDVFAVVIAGVTQEGLFAVVVILFFVVEEPVVTANGATGELGLNGPAGEGAGAVPYVVFCVVAYAHAEEFQQFTAPVLVDRIGVVVVVVQPVNHGWVFGHFKEQFAEIAHSPVTELDDHVHYIVVVVNLGNAGGEDSMPEKGHLLFQGALGVYQVMQPLGCTHAGKGAGTPGPGVEAHHFVTIQFFMLF